MPFSMRGRRPVPASASVCLATALFLFLWLALAAGAQAKAFILQPKTLSVVASAVPVHGPAAGDQNPYGVAVAPTSTGNLVKGDVLVSNFNDAANAQGTGSSIVEISPSGVRHVFALVPPPTSTPVTGLTTALVALRSGWVVVGSLPAPGGMAANATAGALSVINPMGQVVKTITARDINGPWDMTASDGGGHAYLFVTNVLNGTVAAGGKTVPGGTVVRIKLTQLYSAMPHVASNQVIADGFAEHTDPNALVVGPTGVGLGSDGTLYVAGSVFNRIASIPNAVSRTSVLHHAGHTVTVGGPVNDPLGLMIAPNGDVVEADGADGAINEFMPSGAFVATRTLVPNGAGDLFGLALTLNQRGFYFVNDSGSGPAANSLQLAH
jgi:hypothetical protein